MTLNEVLDSGNTFAVNFFTGEIIGRNREGCSVVVVKGDLDDPATLCRLLFDKEAIDDGWDAICRRMVYDKLVNMEQNNADVVMRAFEI